MKFRLIHSFLILNLAVSNFIVSNDSGTAASGKYLTTVNLRPSPSDRSQIVPEIISLSMDYAEVSNLPANQPDIAIAMGPNSSSGIGSSVVCASCSDACCQQSDASTSGYTCINPNFLDGIITSDDSTTLLGIINSDTFGTETEQVNASIQCILHKIAMKLQNACCPGCKIQLIESPSEISDYATDKLKIFTDVMADISTNSTNLTKAQGTPSDSASQSLIGCVVNNDFIGNGVATDVNSAETACNAAVPSAPGGCGNSYIAWLQGATSAEDMETWNCKSSLENLIGSLPGAQKTVVGQMTPYFQSMQQLSALLQEYKANTKDKLDIDLGDTTIQKDLDTDSSQSLVTGSSTPTPLTPCSQQFIYPDGKTLPKAMFNDIVLVQSYYTDTTPTNAITLGSKSLAPVMNGGQIGTPTLTPQGLFDPLVFKNISTSLGIDKWPADAQGLYQVQNGTCPDKSMGASYDSGATGCGTCYKSMRDCQKQCTNSECTPLENACDIADAKSCSSQPGCMWLDSSSVCAPSAAITCSADSTPDEGAPEEITPSYAFPQVVPAKPVIFSKNDIKYITAKNALAPQNLSGAKLQAFNKTAAAQLALLNSYVNNPVYSDGVNFYALSSDLVNIGIATQQLLSAPNGLTAFAGYVEGPSVQANVNGQQVTVSILQNVTTDSDGNTVTSNVKINNQTLAVDINGIYYLLDKKNNATPYLGNTVSVNGNDQVVYMLEGVTISGEEIARDSNGNYYSVAGSGDASIYMLAPGFLDSASASQTATKISGKNYYYLQVSTTDSSGTSTATNLTIADQNIATDNNGNYFIVSSVSSSTYVHAIPTISSLQLPAVYAPSNIAPLNYGFNALNLFNQYPYYLAVPADEKGNPIRDGNGDYAVLQVNDLLYTACLVMENIQVLAQNQLKTYQQTLNQDNVSQLMQSIESAAQTALNASQQANANSNQVMQDVGFAITGGFGIALGKGVWDVLRGLYADRRGFSSIDELQSADRSGFFGKSRFGQNNIPEGYEEVFINPKTKQPYTNEEWTKGGAADSFREYTAGNLRGGISGFKEAYELGIYDFKDLKSARTLGQALKLTGKALKGAWGDYVKAGQPPVDQYKEFLKYKGTYPTDPKLKTFTDFDRFANAEKGELSKALFERAQVRVHESGWADSGASKQIKSIMQSLDIKPEMLRNVKANAIKILQENGRIVKFGGKLYAIIEEEGKEAVKAFDENGNLSDDLGKDAAGRSISGDDIIGGGNDVPAEGFDLPVGE